LISQSRRIVGVTVTAAVVVALIGLYVGLYLTNNPGAASAAPSAGGGVNLYLATVAASEPTDPHPSWVSYYAVDSGAHNWRHQTTFVLPANTDVHVTIYQFDGQSGLRNPFVAQSRGTVGGNFMLDGKPTQVIGPDTASHIFEIAQLGVSVPLMGIAHDATNPCDSAPCLPSMDHHTISFTFHTGKKGLYRWQCYVPCAAGFVAGFGGPMQTVGYMDGFIKVV
jgi:hypothetical protein